MKIFANVVWVINYDAAVQISLLFLLFLLFLFLLRLSSFSIERGRDSTYSGADFVGVTAGVSRPARAAAAGVALAVSHVVVAATCANSVDDCRCEPRLR